MRNKMAYFGLLGFLGILGVVTDNRGYLGFFGFLVFFRYFFVVPDELFNRNIQRAAVAAFFTSVALQALTISVAAFTKERNHLIIGLSLSFSISVALFIVILVVSEFSEYRGN